MRHATKVLLAAASALALTAMTAPVWAVPIATGSEISINGPDNFTNSSITFTGVGNLQGFLGSYAELAPGCTSCVTMAASISPSFSGQLFTVTVGADTATMVLNAGSSFVPGGTGQLPDLTVNGTGTLTLTGFDPTAGAVEVTTQGSTGMIDVTFSATAVPNPVPEPSSLVVIGAGMIGLAAMKYGWRKPKLDSPERAGAA